MTYEEHVVKTRTDEVVARDEVPARDDVPARDEVPARSEVVSSQTQTRQTRFTPSSGELLRRFVVLIFGLIQLDIGLRIILLLLNAREGNALVQFILDTSQLFVAPFEGIFRTNALHSGGSILDVAAIAALIGWTVIEAIVLWIVSLFRREPFAA